LQALSNQQALPEYAVQATTLLKQLGTEITTHAADELAGLRAIAEQAEKLFAACERTLEEQTATSYVEDQMAEVLRSMGYQVAQIAAEEPSQPRTMFAAVDDKLGIEFHLDKGGKVGTEIVALTPEAADLDHANQEKVCGLIDRVFQAMRGRECEVRERHRKRLRSGQQLRVVELPKTTITTVQEIQEPKRMRAEE
jgi:hypothetical protein